MLSVCCVNWYRKKNRRLYDKPSEHKKDVRRRSGRGTGPTNEARRRVNAETRRARLRRVVFAIFHIKYTCKGKRPSPHIQRCCIPSFLSAREIDIRYHSEFLTNLLRSTRTKRSTIHETFNILSDFQEVRRGNRFQTEQMVTLSSNPIPSNLSSLNLANGSTLSCHVLNTHPYDGEACMWVKGRRGVAGERREGERWVTLSKIPSAVNSGGRTSSLGRFSRSITFRPHLKTSQQQ